MTLPGWYPFREGTTLGSQGSESGTILQDDEHSLGARITLERTNHYPPFAITCGIYGWIFHTRFFKAEAEALKQFDKMKAALSSLLDHLPLVNESTSEFCEGIAAFVRQFP